MLLKLDCPADGLSSICRVLESVAQAAHACAAAWTQGRGCRGCMVEQQQLQSIGHIARLSSNCCTRTSQSGGRLRCLQQQYKLFGAVAAAVHWWCCCYGHGAAAVGPACSWEGPEPMLHWRDSHSAGQTRHIPTAGRRWFVALTEQPDFGQVICRKNAQFLPNRARHDPALRLLNVCNLQGKCDDQFLQSQVVWQGVCTRVDHER